MFEVTPELIKLVESDEKIKKAFATFMAEKLEAETLALKHKKLQMKRDFDRASGEEKSTEKTQEEILPERF